MPIIAPPQAPTSATYVQLGRLALPTIGHDFKEAVGEALDTVGDGVALGQRRPKGYGFTVPLLAIPDASTSDFVAVGLRMRRQLRSILQNAQLRGQAVYLQCLVDPELNGWVIPGNGQIAWEQGGPMFGNFLLTLDELYRIGTPWTHRPGIKLVTTDVRLATTPRDFRGQIFSTNFAANGAIALNYLPTGTTSLKTASGLTLTQAQWVGAEGLAPLVSGALDGDAISFEQTDAVRLMGGVIAYDRRGYVTAPTPAADPLWEEVYGRDWPWSWQTPGLPLDTPVLMNGRCRVRYDASVGLPGFRVDVWTGSAWSEQAKVIFRRSAASLTSDDTWISAGLTDDCTPERTTMFLTLRSSTDANSYETVYVTLQRGWSGPRFELYAQPGAAAAGGAIVFYNAIPGGPAATVSGNAWAQLPPSAPYMVAGAFVQAATSVSNVSDSLGYGTAMNGVSTQVDGQGYASLRLGFYGSTVPAASAAADLGPQVLMDCRQIPVLLERA